MIFRKTTVPVIITAMVIATMSYGAVNVSVDSPKTKKVGEKKQVSQSVTLSNEVVQYRLTYDITRDPDNPQKITSHYWGWKQEFVTIGMTGPSRPNWYWQAFFNWYFDDESLHNRPAEMNVIRKAGPDGMVEYVWDTPRVRASVRFALTSESDKLLMFGSYEPKQPINNSRLKFSCYPATFSKPRNRAVTTSKGTFRPGQTINLDLQNERWILYEDTTKGRPASGSAGMIIGTPNAFSHVRIPVADYGIDTKMKLAPNQRSFAVGLYDFPTLPDYERTRQYFRKSADTQAQKLQKIASGDLDQPLPPIPIAEQRLARLMKEGRKALDRPAELWRPKEKRMEFPWADRLPNGPIHTGIFCRRWTAWSTMELARRLQMDAEHAYFDSRTKLSNPRNWPYRNQTGIGPVQYGVAARNTNRISKKMNVELFLCAGIVGTAVPPVTRTTIASRVRNGKGLLLVGKGDVLKGWNKDMFANEAPQIAKQALDGLDWNSIPGYQSGDPGRITDGIPVRAWRYGKGRVLHLRIRRPRYSALVPKNSAAEGLQGIRDRCLAIAGKAALVAAGRKIEPSMQLQVPEHDGAPDKIAVRSELPKGSQLLVRLQDDLDRTVDLRKIPSASDAGTIQLPVLPTGRKCFLDAIAQNSDGTCLSYAFTSLPQATGPAIADISLQPSTLIHEAAVPIADLPDGGNLNCTIKLENTADLKNAVLLLKCRDCVGRLVGRTTAPVPAGRKQIAATMDIPPPVVVPHKLDVALMSAGDTVAFARQRFTIPVPYSYDDFTALMWTYAGGDPVLQHTNRICYEQGADMCDLCHMGAYSGAGAAREYSITARSGLRLLPYVTRLAGRATDKHYRQPCLHDPEHMKSRRQSLKNTCIQAAPYFPAAYTLGDENYLFRGNGECCHSPHSVKAFREWLKNKYGDIDNLNRAWPTDYETFDDLKKPMLLTQVAKRESSFAPWIDHKLFMDTTFAGAHREFRDAIRDVDPGAKAGWDGILGYSWRSGYDFTKMTDGLQLNETYTKRWLQGELVRSFKEPDALTGKWGNAVADNEDGWSAFPWDCLLKGDNSVWWWTSWGVDYIPFNPDLSLSKFGQWFFDAVKEVKVGPGKLLLHAKREHSKIGIFYSHSDMFAAAVFGQMLDNSTFAGDRTYLNEHRAFLRGIQDLGYQAVHLGFSDLQQGAISPDEYKVLFLPLAGCLSDQQVENLRRYVQAGGTLIVDGRAALLNGKGRVRDDRPLDPLLGIETEAGLHAIKTDVKKGELTITGKLRGATASHEVAIENTTVRVIEPGLSVAGGNALGKVDDTPVCIINRKGDGAAITLNFGLQQIRERRTEQGPKPLQNIVDAIVRSAGVRPPCRLTTPDGRRPLCTQRILYTDGPLQYLALHQNILQPHMPPQQAHVQLNEPSVVYDIRAGKRLGNGEISEWDVRLSRGHPQVYALLPYEVSQVHGSVPKTAPRGEAVTIDAGVSVTAEKPGFHVLRLNVFEPGSTQPHREYSQNIACDGGNGTGTIPFAINDDMGRWRLQLRDTASGKTTELSVVVP